MSETTEQLTSAPANGRRGDGLQGMVLTDLKAMAAQMGLKGTSTLRKGDLIAAITAHQNGSATPKNTQPAAQPAKQTPNGHAEPTLDLRLPEGEVDRPATGRRRAGRAQGPAAPAAAENAAPTADRAPAAEPSADRPTEGAAANPTIAGPAPEAAPTQSPATGQSSRDETSPDGSSRPPARERDYEDGNRNRRNRRNRRDRNDRADRGEGAESTADYIPGHQGSRNGSVNGSARTNGSAAGTVGSDTADTTSSGPRRDATDRRDADDDGQGGRRGRRFRERNRRGRDRFGGDAATQEPELRDDDVLVPVAGIVDVLDSYAFIRTSGYLSGPNDVYVSLSQVRKNGLRRGDAVTGAVRAARDGEQQRQKFNALIRLDTINGQDPETAKQRPEFTKLTPLYPNERLRLETTPNVLTTRVIDLVMPVGKGQRALIVSPPKAGKTSVLQAVANAITTNNPEVHLMVVLVDERPEEVTDMQRSVKGEVIASTFDRPPADHTMVAELSIERAKRLVEMGRDVVVLLDSITRLGRAYNLAAPASGRILSGGVDSTALFPPKRFLGAARNIENGGSLTIFASALVETGSAGDTVIFEEFKGTGNAELKLDRKLADKRIFPAIDVDQSSTRKEDLLLSPDELAVVVKLRRLLSALDPQQAIELVLDRLRKSNSNVEFLLQVAKNTPMAERD